MPRCLAYALPIAFVVLTPRLSLAASDDCPDGWFCDPNAAPQPSQPSPPPSPAAQPPAPGAPPQPGVPPGGDATGYAQPSYPPPPRDPNETELSLQVPPDNPPPQHRRRRRFREWGFNLHLEAALLGNDSGRASNTGMGGVGFAFRYRMLPPLAFEAGIDLLTGTDQQGFARSEAALLLNTLLFFNPHDVVQVYVLGGLGFSGANVTIAPRAVDTYFKRHDEHYSYFGGQLGLGFEVRVSRRIAIAGDLIGFLRARTDQRVDDSAFVDSNSQGVNDTTGGGLLRGGVTFYW